MKSVDIDNKLADFDNKSANIDNKSADIENKSADNQTFDLIVAGDLVYDNDITDALLSFIQDALSTQPSIQVLVALEKRFVFTLQELDVVAPAYDHLTAKLNQMKNMRVEYLYTSFKQFFCYERSKDMVLMKITNQ